MDLENGIITLDDEKIEPGYSFDDFCNSSFYRNQDGDRVIFLEGIKRIDSNNY